MTEIMTDFVITCQSVIFINGQRGYVWRQQLPR